MQKYIQIYVIIFFMVIIYKPILNAKSNIDIEDIRRNIHASVDVNIEYDDNIFLEPVDTQSDFIFILSPEYSLVSVFGSRLLLKVHQLL